jgi:hypothetical protein
MCLSCDFLDGNRASNLEVHFVRVNFVVATDVQRHPHVHEGVSGQGAQFESFPHALIDGLVLFRRHHAALDVVDEFVFFAIPQGFTR